MSAYYNEIDSYAAQWLRNLIAAGHIAPGDVDERDIRDVRAYDLTGYSQCHFFAGIGGWSYALRLAGWPDDRPVWTGSCPCQPFSTAGKRKGFEDERHLWPVWCGLIRKCGSPVIFGEQVARGSGLWLDAVHADLEDQGYAVGAAILPACSVGAPHIRERLWFVASDADRQSEYDEPVDAEVAALPKSVSYANGAGLPPPGAQPPGAYGQPSGGVSASADRWSVEPDVGRVAHGIPNRVGRLRAYGNAIVPQVAAEFIKAYLDCRN